MNLENMIGQKSLREEIEEALKEAKMLEQGLTSFDEDHMLYVAQKLCNAPFSFVLTLYNEQKVRRYD